MNEPKKYLDPIPFTTARDLDLEARLLVEGFLSGMHKSPYHGFSVEFAQHREYVPGDDNKHVDWKVYGRTGKFFLKQYEEETNLSCWLLVDLSESMRYGSLQSPETNGVITKYDYACLTAAALSYLILHQQDSVGLITFDSQVRGFINPSSQPSHFKEIINVLNRGCGGEKSRLAPIFHDLAERINLRATILPFSHLLH